MKHRSNAEQPPAIRQPRIGLMATNALRTVGLRAILGDSSFYDVIVIASAPGWERQLAVDLLVLDPDSDTEVADVLAVSQRMRPVLKVIVLGVEDDLQHIEMVIGAGAKGYLSHSAGERELRAAIQVVLDGSVWAPRKVMSRLLEDAQRRARSGLPDAPIRFTRRELEVMRLLVLGHANRDIASALSVDEGTVKAHMGRLMRKAGVGNRTALTMRALEAGWI